MKFFSLCLFILSSFFAIAQTPVPEQDRKYLQQEEDENGYGCILKAGWKNAFVERLKCIDYCRPPRAGDEEIIVQCYVDFPQLDPHGEIYPNFSCLGVENNEEEAKTEASAICTYRLMEYCNANNCKSESGTINTFEFISCKPAKVCFDVDYDEDNRPLILIEKQIFTR